MDIESLADFVTLAACRSFSKAAAARNVTQPAFSRRIRVLETAVGADLVDRHDKNFRLTSAGERFLVHARSMVELSQRAVAEAKSAVSRLQDPVYLIAPSYLSKTFFPPWYKAMQKAVSCLTMRTSYLRGSTAAAELQKGTADFALVLHHPKIAGEELDGLEHIVVGQERIVAVHGRQCRTPENLLLYEQGSYMARCADLILGKKKAERQVAFESSSTGMLQQMALAGFGTAVVPESLAEDDLSQGYLVHAPGPRLECDILLVRANKLSHARAEKLWQANVRAVK